MSKVRVLSPEVISRIAAGEVVERPASVVKELVENAIDAGGDRLEVVLKEGGKTLIQVRDNGSGIAQDDLGALFTRHATSKIASAEDLEAVLSFGFRGEALYSIGAVAHVTLRSRLKGCDEAWLLGVQGGARMPLVPAPMATHGTEINVEGLFFNTPARRKFLKSDAAEAEAAAGAVLPYALLKPAAHVTFTHNTRVVFDLPPAKGFMDRAARALGFEARHLKETSGEATEFNACWTIVFGDINVQRSRRDTQYIFVNGRPVQSKNLSFHLNEAFSLLFPPATFGFFILMLEVPAGEVDVNVHPAKREVKIRHENEIAFRLRRSLEQALMTQSPAREADAREPIFPFASGATAPVVDEGVPASRIVFAPGQKGWAPELRGVSQEAVRDQLFHDTAPVLKSEGLKERLLRARFIGTFGLKYHLWEEGASLFVIDQHAAQERVLFEKFRDQVAAHAVEVQHVLAPLLVRLTPEEMLAWEEVAGAVKDLGFETTLFDKTTLGVQAHPALLKNPEHAIRALLGRETARLTDPDALARRACRASVMAGDIMHGVEAVHQLKELLACEDPYTCPHGRPVVVELKTSFLDRQFLR
jgi:DNA mismatch repair protein MutL